MIIEYELTVDDFVISSFYDFQKSLTVRLMGFFYSFVVSVFSFPLILFLYYSSGIDILSGYSQIVFLFFVFMPIPLIFLLTLYTFSRYRKLKLKKSIIEVMSGVRSRKYALSIDEKGISTTSNDVKELIVWSVVENIVVTDKHIYIHLMSNRKIIISRRLFRNILEQKEFIELVCRYYNDTTGINLQSN